MFAVESMQDVPDAAGSHAIALSDLGHCQPFSSQRPNLYYLSVSEFSPVVSLSSWAYARVVASLPHHILSVVVRRAYE